MVAKAKRASREFETLADLHERLGFVPLRRIRMQPAPGTATEKDLLAIPREEGRFELIDGTLVEKTPMGWKEGMWAIYLGYWLIDHVRKNDLGIAFGADSPYRLRLGLVRVPDLSFVPWSRLPGEEAPDVAISNIIPTLAVEVLSANNRAGEIKLKIQQFFQAGVELVWIVDPKKRIVKVYKEPSKFEVLDIDSALDGGGVVPGFHLNLRDYFSEGTRKKK